MDKIRNEGFTSGTTTTNVTERKTLLSSLLTTASSRSLSLSSLSLSSNHSLDNTSSGGNGTGKWQDAHSDFYDDVLRPVISLLIGIIGLPTILLLIAVTLTPTYRKYSYSLYLTVTSIYDFIFIGFEFVDSILQIRDGKYIRDLLVWEVPCRLYEYLFYVSMNISMWMNVAVSVDRFIVIAFPFKKDAWCNRRNSWIVCGGLMVIIHCSGIGYIVHGKVFYFPGYGYYCNGEEILMQFDMFMSYIGGVFLAIIAIVIFSSLSVFKLFRIKMKRLKMTSQQSSSGKDKTSRATVALVGIGVCAFVTQMPYVVNEMVRLYARYNDKQLWTSLWLESSPQYEIAVKSFEALSFIINVQNFFVLFILNRQFRKDVANLFFRQPATKRYLKSSLAIKSTDQRDHRV